MTSMTFIIALYIFVLAAFTGYVVISRVPSILHTPLMSGSNFIHGIVVVGALTALFSATDTAEQVIGFLGVLLGAGNVVGGYAVTDRMLAMFRPSIAPAIAPATAPPGSKPAGDQKAAS
ncbi:putative NAD(P) transhydrogenase subunit alpha part 2 [Gluconacetobacter diazotrophicus PA1 5]|uniref:proton-translocating NAD(P)(+) transhydrogenase n=2 Tax=Gluconacetobacter diazotrophicus TaxID=33996 RepID=A9H541_GLUDA|nr:putative NAD(P) transhydrogenase subunit alpha part 2 [Gluconacetobacter diazotrophicus PA1 5]TWB02525.1 NAD(P) transhydrogenase subunit alpha [Gluconacetobacter diazotrophicus]CAP54285.1 putative NAD(P) transhydrogenase subunit alpha part 2 [Gluconacetobacter diazotrophicus PA1 5]